MMIRRTLCGVTFALLVLAAMGAVPARAQDGPPDRRGPRPRRDLIDAVRFWRMVDAVHLSEDQVPSAMMKVKAMEGAERDFQENRRESLDRILRLLDEAKPDEGRLHEEVSKLRDAEETFRRERAEARDELMAALSVEQQARLLVFEEEFLHHLQDLRERARSEGGPPDGDRRPRRRVR